MRLQSQIDCTANIDNNTNTLAGDRRQGKSYHACANWSAKSPEVGILNEARYAGSPSYASAAFRLHDTKGPGKQSKRYRANFSARRTTVWRNPAHVGLWRCVHCAKNSAGVNKAGYPSVGTRRRSMIKANARCLTVVSAITEYWHRKFRHVRYVWFGESLQKHSKFIAKSSSRGLGSQQWSH